MASPVERGIEPYADARLHPWNAEALEEIRTLRKTLSSSLSENYMGGFRWTEVTFPCSYTRSMQSICFLLKEASRARSVSHLPSRHPTPDF